MDGVPGLAVQHRHNEAAVGAAEPVNDTDVLVADGEVEQFEVLLDAGGRHRLGDDRRSPLDLQSWLKY